MTDNGDRYEGKMTRERVPVRLGPVVEIAPNYGGDCPNCPFAYEISFQVGKDKPVQKQGCSFPNEGCIGKAPEGHEWRLALFAKEATP